MNILVTGGAGFIGRWVVRKLLEDGHQVWVLDDLSNGRIENMEELLSHKNFRAFIHGDIKDEATVQALFYPGIDLCYHLAASINVQDSIDDPVTTFHNDTIGTFYLLEECRKRNVKMVFMSTCMVYDRAVDDKGIAESDPIKPASPYAGAKIAAENMVLSYYYAYDLPVTVVRPFNTYGPFQKTGGEGGVVAIFIKNKLHGLPLQIYGDGRQTRDLLYVEDCAGFVVEAGYQSEVDGEIVNAGLGRDISVNDLAALIVEDESRIEHIEHIHPQSEIPKLLCDYRKAKRLLDWEPAVTLEEGIRRTEEWIKTTKLI
ncbi:SDR family NAD(P)-dependent oxidoreductase [Halobacillus sp. ACCC02827]|uniref:dTDP-glucose 4,6-dehydratase n=1 Tax=Bacillaceae TaxID=186817 RepID=UPI0002A4D19F|nr:MULTISPECIES: SDR family NAD(P)-dependent oxidoreductase [Bacillaceae]ELK48297.1 NAD-dependent epimerase/dehydratase family protein [Halobacillus sp. BAB-2008]QHT45530.1 SDR family NAD(P)-dependent oxidoreductase [Bacillus sp. SB49]WJE16332.1 SDR family NAD(P)-dependent oxidoreductase [Halobacillus sp. ACCC02827]